MARVLKIALHDGSSFQLDMADDFDIQMKDWVTLTGLNGECLTFHSGSLAYAHSAPKPPKRISIT